MPVDLRLTVLAHDPLFPLFRGDIAVEGVSLTIDHKTPIIEAFRGDGLPAAEVSLNRFVIARSRGDDRYIGLPVFTLSGFRHRNFFVRADSERRSLQDLRGARVGVDSWPDTGNFWGRVAMREAGVDIPDVSWWTGLLEGTGPRKALTALDAPPPAGMVELPEGATLVAALEAGEIDAVMTSAFAPAGIFSGAGKFRRLIEDYPRAEVEYFQRTQVFPAFHIVAIQRAIAERHPGLPLALYEALRRSWDSWWERAEHYTGPFAWTSRELELASREMPDFHPPFGAKSVGQRRMLEVLCAEQLAQGMVQEAADPHSIFSEFEALRESDD